MTEKLNQVKLGQALEKDRSRKLFYLFLRLKKAGRKMLADLTPPLIYRLFVPRAKRQSVGERYLTGKGGKPLTVNDIHPAEFAFISGSAKISIPISRMRYAGGLRFDREQHHFVRYLDEGINALKTFYSRHQPSNIVEKHFLKSTSKQQMPLKGLPWIMYGNGHFDRNVTTEKGLSASHGHQHHGPVSPEKIALEASHLDRLLASFRKHGLMDTDDYPSGHFILDDEGEWAFYVKDGQHRISVMAYMGYEMATVTTIRSTISAVTPATVNDWPMVRRNLISKEDALAILKAYTAPDRKLDIFGD